MDADDLKELVGRAKAGDRKALDRIFRLHLDDLRKWVHRKRDPKLRAKFDTSDIVQSGAREAIRTIDRFEYRGPGSLFRWLCRIVERVAYAKREHFLLQRRDIRREVSLDARRRKTSTGSGPRIPAPGTEPSKKAEKAERKRLLLAEVERLTEPHRTVVQLRLRDLTYAEIGKRLGKTADEARHMHARAMVILGRRLRRLGSWSSG